MLKTSTWVGNGKLRACLVGNALAVALSIAQNTAAAEATFQFQQLKSFGFADQMGMNPSAPLLEGKDGLLYGTADGGLPGLSGVVFRINTDGTGYQALHQFGNLVSEGFAPSGGLIEGSDGALYGTASKGGTNLSGSILYGGTVFRLNKDGSGFTVLHNFAGRTDGENPQGKLLEATNGMLYGTTTGGTSSGGTLYQLNKDGSGYSVLVNFSYFAQPSAGVIQGTDGALYGTVRSDGTNSAGTVFKINPDGSGYTVLHHFAGSYRLNGSDGAYPVAPLFQASDGALYGTTSIGGATNSGTVFRLNLDGTGYSVLHSFNIYNADGCYPNCGLVEGTNGALYGTNPNGGTNGIGSIFALNKDGSAFNVVHRFVSDGTDGDFPSPGLVRTRDGGLYGTAFNSGRNGVGTVFKLNGDGTGYETIFNFSYAGGDGVNPQSSLVEGLDGSIYGTTPYGGAGRNQGPSGQFGGGIVFKMNKDGSGYKRLHSFSLAGDGESPVAGLLAANDGSLYGTTSGGGSNTFGSVFKLQSDGTGYAILHHFSGLDGQSPTCELIKGTDGMLYGTTSGGGSNNSGIVFKLATDGNGYGVLHQFTFAGGDGMQPASRVIEGHDGSLYGTTYSGGSNDFGTVFKLQKDGTGYTILHAFNYDGVDGLRPNSSLVAGSDGELYGTTTQGGSLDYGTVFKMNSDGTDYQILHSFGAWPGPDGQFPAGNLIEGGDEALYGTVAYGGSGACEDGCGTLFRLNKDGTGYTVLSFGQGLPGVNPRSGLIQASDGALYGSTTAGGASNFGTLFSLQKLIIFRPLPINGKPFGFSISAIGNGQVRIQRSTDLIHWLDWLTVVMGNAPLELTDPSAGPGTSGFYRAVSP